jgi:hypothetical protein
MPENYPAEQADLFKYNVHLYGGRTTLSGAQTIYIYPTTNDWDENSVTWNSHPVCDYKTHSRLYLDEEKNTVILMSPPW